MSDFHSLSTFVPGMKRSLYQYFFFLLLVILTCGGADSLHHRTNDSQPVSKAEIPTISSSVSRKNANSHQEKLALPHRSSSHYSRDYQDRHQILGELNDADSEEEETSETKTSTELIKFAKADLWNAVFAFVKTFHNNESAVYFAHSDYQDFPIDALYIQYRVIRL